MLLHFARFFLEETSILVILLVYCLLRILNDSPIDTIFLLKIIVILYFTHVRRANLGFRNGGILCEISASLLYLNVSYGRISFDSFQYFTMSK